MEVDLIWISYDKGTSYVQVEWFDAKEKGRVIDSKLIMVPDEYSRSLQLTNILKRLQDQLEQQSVVAQYVLLLIRLRFPLDFSVCVCVVSKHFYNYSMWT